MNCSYISSYFLVVFVVCRESLELMTISVILNRGALEALNNDKLWPKFIIDMVLLCNNR